MTSNEAIIRQANEKDVDAIVKLLSPFIESGGIIVMSREALISYIKDFFVCEVDGEVVAAAKFTDYGEDVELAKVCTAADHQGGGRTKAVVVHMIEMAREQKKKRMFGLSVNKNMWSFFESLGFREVSREDLPSLWRENYDFSRPSKGFVLNLSS